MTFEEFKSRMAKFSRSDSELIWFTEKLDDLIEVLDHFAPNITFIQFECLKLKVIKTDYFGVKTVNFEDLFDFLKYRNLLPN